MKTRWIVFVGLILGLALAFSWAGQQTAEQLYKSGLYEEDVSGNLQKAIGIYQGLLERFPDNRGIAAKAQLHIGLCYEKLGKAEAVKAYEVVLSRFAEQAEVVAQARARLNVLRSTAETGRGPTAHRMLTTEDIGVKNLILMKPSPDAGRVIYMDENGAIILRDVLSGQLETLAQGLPAAFNGFPLWSPDGKQVAYVKIVGLSKGDIKILDLSTRKITAISGTEFTIKTGVSLAIVPVDWSRDGRLLLLGPATIGADTRGPLGMVSVDGGTVTILADSAAGSASFSPDSRFVTFASGDKGKEHIFVRPVGGGNAIRITDDNEGGNTSPFWSPDGQAIAYQCSEGIRLVHVAGGKASGDSKLVYSTAATLLLSAWTEAGGLFFTLYEDAKIPYRVSVDPAKGIPIGPIEELPHYPTTPKESNQMESCFAWSPDMNRVAFTGWSRHIAVYKVDGSSVTTHLIVEPGEQVRSLWWSNDGKEIFYLSSLSKGQLAVNAVDPSNGKIREVFPPAMSPVMISESRDGHRQLIFYRVSDDGSMRGFVVKEAGQTAGKLIAPWTDSNGVQLSGHAKLSPKGDHLFFGRQIRKPEENAGSLWMISTDGTGLRKLGSVNFLTSALWDPNSRFVAYTGMMGKNPDVVRIVDVSNGKDYEVPLLADMSNVTVTDWSRDGKFIGIVAKRSRLEFWVLQGLQEERR